MSLLVKIYVRINNGAHSRIADGRLHGNRIMDCTVGLGDTVRVALEAAIEYDRTSGRAVLGEYVRILDDREWRIELFETLDTDDGLGVYTFGCNHAINGYRELGNAATLKKAQEAADLTFAAVLKPRGADVHGNYLMDVYNSRNEYVAYRERRPGTWNFVASQACRS